MAAGKYNFIIEQGATTNFELQYLDPDDTPVDLTNYKARMQLKNQKGGDETYLTLDSTLEDDGTGINLRGSNGDKPFSSGSLGIYISADVTSNLTFDTAFYDLEIFTNDQYPKVYRLLEGSVKLSKNITLGSF